MTLTDARNGCKNPCFYTLAVKRPPSMIRPEPTEHAMTEDNAALKLAPPETIEVDDTRIACDGGGGALGHPRVYLQIGEEGFVDCGYCDRRFVLRAGASAH